MHVTYCSECEDNVSVEQVNSIRKVAVEVGLIVEDHMIHCEHGGVFATRISKINGWGREGDWGRLAVTLTRVFPDESMWKGFMEEHADEVHDAFSELCTPEFTAKFGPPAPVEDTGEQPEE